MALIFSEASYFMKVLIFLERVPPTYKMKLPKGKNYPQPIIFFFYFNNTIICGGVYLHF